VPQHNWLSADGRSGQFASTFRAWLPGLCKGSYIAHSGFRVILQYKTAQCLLFLRRSKPFIELRPAPPPGDILYGNREGLLLPNQHH